MGNLTPVAFDIETSGLDREAEITVAGFTDDLSSWMVLNTDSREADREHLLADLRECSSNPVGLRVVADEAKLLDSIHGYVDERLNSDEYLTAYNGETWNGGFDLPFLQSTCHRHNVAWPFDDVAYADTMEAIQRFDTGGHTDLVGVSEELLDEEYSDPFDDSGEAVEAWKRGDWLPLLKHNLADIERTRALAMLASEYVPKSDFSIKNLAPPQE